MTSTSVGQRGEQRERREMVGHDDVGLGDRLPAAHGDQPGVAGPAADEHDAAGPAARRRAGRAVGDAAVGEPGDDGVPHADRALRIPAAVHADDEIAVPADRGGPGAGGGPVVGRAQKMRTRSASSATAALTAGSSVAATAYQAPARSPGVAAAAPGQRARLDQRLQGGGDLGTDDGDPRARLEQAGHPAVGHLPAAHHDDAPAGQPQADRVDDPGLRVDRGRVHAHRIAADCYAGSGACSPSPPGAGTATWPEGPARLPLLGAGRRARRNELSEDGAPGRHRPAGRRAAVRRRTARREGGDPAARHGEPLPTVTHVHLHDGPKVVHRYDLEPLSARPGSTTCVRRWPPARDPATRPSPTEQPRAVGRRAAGTSPALHAPRLGDHPVEPRPVQRRALPAHRGRVELQQPVEPHLAGPAPGVPGAGADVGPHSGRGGPRRRRRGRGPGWSAAGRAGPSRGGR